MNKPLYSESCTEFSTQKFSSSTESNDELKSEQIKWYEKNDNNKQLKTKFTLILFITLLFGLLQLGLSYFSSSLSLISDAFHQIIDSGSIFICLLAIKYSKKKANSQFTYGYYRIEILASLCCNVIIILVMGSIFVTSLMRICSNYIEGKEEVIIDPNLMIKSAVIGIICDIFLFLVLRSKSFYNFYHSNHKCCAGGH
jgi:cobalt-zinc-cadmium efflux system protein